MDLEEIGRDHLRLGADLAPGHRGRGTCDRRRARAVGAEAVGCRVGVALLDRDCRTGMPISDARIWAKVVAWPWPWLIVPSRAIAEPVGWIRISQESNMPSPRMSQFLTGPAPTISVKKATPMPISSGSRRAERRPVLLLLLPQALVVDGRQRLVHRGLIVAGIVFPAQRRVIGELLLADEVLQPQFSRVHRELAGQHVDHPLDEDRTPRSPGTSSDRRRRPAPCWCRPRRRRGARPGCRRSRCRCEKAGRELGRVGAGIERAVVGEHVALEAGDLPSLVAAILPFMW